jgi:hypothetical protein
MILLENDEVKIFNTKSELDGISGIICGKTSEYPGGAIYVVRIQNEARPLLRKLGYAYSCIGMPLACLERIA